MLAPSQTVQDLQRARNLIADPEKWCQGRLAEDRAGAAHFYDNYDGEPVRFCAIGAEMHVRGIAINRNTKISEYSPFLASAAHQLFNRTPDEVNDILDHADVLRMYDRAIQLAMAGSHA